MRTKTTQRQQNIRINRLSKKNENLSKKLEFVKEQLKWSRITSSQETDLKNSCFFFLISKSLFAEWREWHYDRLMGKVKRAI